MTEEGSERERERERENLREYYGASYMKSVSIDLTIKIQGALHTLPNKVHRSLVHRLYIKIGQFEIKKMIHKHKIY